MSAYGMVPCPGDLSKSGYHACSFDQLQIQTLSMDNLLKEKPLFPPFTCILTV